MNEGLPGWLEMDRVVHRFTVLAISLLKFALAKQRTQSCPIARTSKQLADFDISHFALGSTLLRLKW